MSKDSTKRFNAALCYLWLDMEQGNELLHNLVDDEGAPEHWVVGELLNIPNVRAQSLLKELANARAKIKEVWENYLVVHKKGENGV